MFGFSIVNTRDNIVVPKNEFIAVPKAELPYIMKAHKLARALSEDKLDAILAREYHLQKYPRKKDKQEANSADKATS